MIFLHFIVSDLTKRAISCGVGTSGSIGRAPGGGDRDGFQPKGRRWLSQAAELSSPGL